jgi:hypothetical protein
MRRGKERRSIMTEPDFETFMAAYPQDVQALAAETRRLILEVIPELIEMVDPPSKIVAYGFDRTYAGLVCAIAPFKTYLNLMFSRGVELPDPNELLRGTGKRARHLRFACADELGKPEVRDMLLEAANLTRTAIEKR